MKSIKEMTNNELREECIKMWEWLRDNPGKSKEDYFSNNFINSLVNIPLFDCYACEAGIGFDDIDCHCPISCWKQDRHCQKDGTPYSKWSLGVYGEDIFESWRNKLNPKDKYFPNKALCYEGAKQMVELVKEYWLIEED